MKYRYKILQITSNSDFILKDLFVFDIKIILSCFPKKE